MVSRAKSHSTPDLAWSRLPAARQKLRDRKAIRRYVEEMDAARDGRQMVLYLNGAMDLVGAMEWRGKEAPALGPETKAILSSGQAIGAAGFILARTCLDQFYHPDPFTVSAVSKLRRLSAELDLPLLDYLVFSTGEPVSVGGP